MDRIPSQKPGFKAIQTPGLYVHVPFCRTKCPYCDFYSITSSSLISAWLEALKKEIALCKDRFSGFDSLYLGGGTPSLLDGRQLSTLVECLHKGFSFAEATETTIEVNPDDITLEKLGLFQELAINRVSVGVQSFQDEELRFLGRRHTAAQTRKALERIRSAGFANLGLDLMYGFDGQSRNSWISTMECALAYHPEHLSCYQMTVEERTPFGKMKRDGKIKSLGEASESDLFLVTSDSLRGHGYIHYEISNFARGDEYISRHNRKYWHHVPYLGLGPSAHSFRDGVRWWNHRSVERYCRALDRGETPVAGTETLSREQLNLESLYLGLRTRDGVGLDMIGGASEKALRELEASELIRIHDGRALPTVKGFLVADSLPVLLSD